MIDVLKRTSLYDDHVRLGAKMVPFAGFEMPVHYHRGITAEHGAVRAAAGLFDVSHMGELLIRGPRALDLVQLVTINDASRLAVGQAQYSALCLDTGGIVDDLLVYRFADRYMLVVNASNVARDCEWVRSHAEGLDVEVEDASEDTALLALQGPAARDVLGTLTHRELDDIAYYRFADGEVAGVGATISATGYTGEDGFELYVAREDAATLWAAILEAGEGVGLVPAGLGARDSLRLEMGYALYGNELDEEHTPLEAGLGWATKLDKGNFVGRESLLAQKEAGVARRLVGLAVRGRGFPRAGYDVLAADRAVGTVTSGTVSPALGHGIAMAYVPTELSKPDTRLHVDARGRLLDAVVAPTPFYTGGSIRR